MVIFYLVVYYHCQLSFFCFRFIVSCFSDVLFPVFVHFIHNIELFVFSFSSSFVFLLEPYLSVLPGEVHVVLSLALTLWWDGAPLAPKVPVSDRWSL